MSTCERFPRPATKTDLCTIRLRPAAAKADLCTIPSCRLPLKRTCARFVFVRCHKNGPVHDESPDFHAQVQVSGICRLPIVHRSKLVAGHPTQSFIGPKKWHFTLASHMQQIMRKAPWFSPWGPFNAERDSPLGGGRKERRPCRGAIYKFFPEY